MRLRSIRIECCWEEASPVPGGVAEVYPLAARAAMRRVRRASRRGSALPRRRRLPGAAPVFRTHPMRQIPHHLSGTSRLARARARAIFQAMRTPAAEARCLPDSRAARVPVYVFAAALASPPADERVPGCLCRTRSDAWAEGAPGGCTPSARSRCSRYSRPATGTSDRPPPGSVPVDGWWCRCRAGPGRYVPRHKPARWSSLLPCGSRQH
jgi:hypothetical protein